MELHESGEMYLETILILAKTRSDVRAIDIAAALDYKKSSVSVAMKNLRQKGYIQTDGGGYITLTQKGRAVAETIYERHTLIAGWLMHLGVDERTAVADACRMEHVISDKSFEAMKNHARPEDDRKIPEG